MLISRGGFGWTQERKLVGTGASVQAQQGGDDRARINVRPRDQVTERGVV
jgi:hypothetical protein